jgi:hypothetical protein
VLRSVASSLLQRQLLASRSTAPLPLQLHCYSLLFGFSERRNL